MRVAVLMTIGIVSFLGFPTHTLAGCTATNDVGDQCSIECPDGWAAQCQNSTGSSRPVCECVQMVVPDDQKAAPESTPETPLVTVVDVTAQLNALLAAFRDVQLPEQCRVERREVCERIPDFGDICGKLRPCSVVSIQSCRHENYSVCSPTSGKLQIVGQVIPTSKSQVTVLEPNWEAVPKSVQALKATYENCTTEEQSKTFRHTERFTKGRTVTKTNALVTGSELQVTAKVNFGGPADLIRTELGGAIKFNQQITISDANSETEQQESLLEITFPVRVKPMTRVTVSHYWIIRNIPVPFSGTVVFDGAVTTNLENKTLASEVLDEKQRTFSYSGEILDAQLGEDKTRLVPRDLTAADCEEKSFRTKILPFGADDQ